MDWLENTIGFDGVEYNVDEECIAFGIPEYFSYFGDFLQDRGYKFLGFCDMDKPVYPSTIYLSGVELISFETFLSCDKNTPVWLFCKDIDVFKYDLIGKGFSNFVNIPPEWLNQCKTNSEAILNHKSSLSEVINTLDDEASKEALKTAVNAKFTMNQKFMDSILTANSIEYLDEDIIHLSDDEVFVDVGAKIGSVSWNFLAKKYARFSKLYLFEPDAAYYDIVSAGARILNFENVEVLNIDLLDSRIKGNKNYMHDASESETAFIAKERLDNIIDRATFIKIGKVYNTLEALMGAKKIIESCRPKLAVYVSHEVNLLWEVPLLIKSICPDYRLYIRNYSVNKDNFVTIYYAV